MSNYTDRVAAVVIMAAFVATMQMVLSCGVVARQSAEFLIVARVGGRPGPRLRSNATVIAHNPAAHTVIAGIRQQRGDDAALLAAELLVRRRAEQVNTADA